MGTTIGTAHTFGALHGHCAVERTTRPLFNSNAVESLAYSALRFRRDTEGVDNLRFTSRIAIFEYNEPTPL